MNTADIARTIAGLWNDWAREASIPPESRDQDTEWEKSQQGSECRRILRRWAARHQASICDE